VKSARFSNLLTRFASRGGPGHRRRRSSGQAIVILAISLLALVAGLGLVIDGGNAWAQQRITQAGNDAAAEAGASVINGHDAKQTAPAGGWDQAVFNAIGASASRNGISIAVSYYTDICGTLLRQDGTKALGEADAAVVGSMATGDLPTNNLTDPDCPSGIVGPVAGVDVRATKQFDVFVSRLIGTSRFTASTRATAVSGLLQGTCSADNGCVVLPVTAPVTVVSCDGSNNPILTSTNWPKFTRVIVPLCKAGPGNVGWLDWTPKGGGASELENSILHPNNPPIDLPSWQFVTETGNVNSKPIDDALNTYDGQVVLFPLFDLTCSSDPDQTQVKVGPTYGCPASDVGGKGSNQWYRFPVFSSFLLEHAWVNGNHKAECDTGNGATSCLIGQFVDFQTSGTVGPGIGGGTTESAVRGVQLIK
jgi:hypothetical protein